MGSPAQIRKVDRGLTASPWAEADRLWDEARVPTRSKTFGWNQFFQPGYPRAFHSSVSQCFLSLTRPRVPWMFFDFHFCKRYSFNKFVSRFPFFFFLPDPFGSCDLLKRQSGRRCNLHLKFKIITQISIHKHSRNIAIRLLSKTKACSKAR